MSEFTKGPVFKECVNCHEAKEDVRYRALPDISGGADLCRWCWLDVQGAYQKPRQEP